MENPRPEKVAIVDEIRDRLTSSEATVLTEYRGLDVGAMQELRRALRAAGADYKIYKNTLARLATQQTDVDLTDQLIGPTAFAFVTETPDGAPGDPVLLAKALTQFAKANDALVLKSGVMAGRLLSVEEIRALAEVAPRDVLLARFAGLLAAPMQRFASLLAAVPRDFAYGLQALIDLKQETEPTPDTTEPAAEPAYEETETEIDKEAEAAQLDRDGEDSSPAAGSTDPADESETEEKQ